MKKSNTIIDDWLRENNNPEIEEFLSGEGYTTQELNRIKELRNKYF